MLRLVSVVLVLCCVAVLSLGQVPIPSRPDGYALSPSALPSAPVVLDAWFDLLCPDSAASWPVVKQVLAAYPTRLYFKLHTFPLPYHTWSFVANEGAHVIHALTRGNLTAVRAYTDLLFDIQQSYYNAATLKLSTQDVEAKLAQDVKAVYADTASFQTQLAGNADINEETRVSWKYGCSRAVTGTPTFHLNGVYIMADASWALSDWQSVIDPLLNATIALESRSSTPPTTQHKPATSTARRTEPEPAALLSAALNKATLVPQSHRYGAPNETCAANTTLCDYEPKKYECCLKGEYCIPNVGCRCVADSC